MPETRFSLKDHLFNEETVGHLGDMMTAADSTFDRDVFMASVMKAMPELELKQRIRMISEVIDKQLPDDYPEAAQVIERALPPPLDPTLTDDDFGDFIIAPLGDYVARHGMQPCHYDMSIALLKKLTMRFSMEGYIRPFLVDYPKETVATLKAWADDPNYHVRRLVSEGTRPTLPWASRIPIDIETPIPLLDKLYVDGTRFVTRSVANHLNDISKIDSDLAISTLRRWEKSGGQDPTELAWITRHALRSLIKKGDPEAMRLLGYSPDPAVEVASFEVLASDTVRIGNELLIEATMVARADERLLIDYVIDFVKKNGSTRPKVFKLKRFEMAIGETRTLTKKHKLPASATTFTLYPGTHSVSLKVNGNVMASADFELAGEG